MTALSPQLFIIFVSKNNNFHSSAQLDSETFMYIYQHRVTYTVWYTICWIKNLLL